MMKKKLKYTITLDSTYNSKHVPYPVTVHVAVRGLTRCAEEVAIAAREVMDAVLAYGSTRKGEG